MKTTKVRVVVTQRDINLGTRGNCERCPIARALRRQGFLLAVWRSWLDDVETGHRVTNLPLKACRAIHMFDNYGRSSVQPFQFTVELPVELVRKARAKR